MVDVPAWITSVAEGRLCYAGSSPAPWPFLSGASNAKNQKYAARPHHRALDGIELNSDFNSLHRVPDDGL